jgi:hypothetical protein
LNRQNAARRGCFSDSSLISPLRPRHSRQIASIGLPGEQKADRVMRPFAARIMLLCELGPIVWTATVSVGKGNILRKTPVLPCATYPETAMNKLLVSVVVLPAAIACLHAPTQLAAQSVTPAGQAGTPFITNAAPQQAPFQPTVPANAQPLYPIPRTMYGEVIAKYRIGSAHKAVYANLAGNQVWCIVQSKFGQPSQQSAIAEARRACEDHAVQTNLDPSKCIPIAVDDWQVFDAGPLFSVAERAQDQQANLSTLVTPPRE